MTIQQVDKESIQQLGLNAIKEYFNVDPSKFDKEFLTHFLQKAKLGMQFEKEMNLSKRAVEMNYIRVFKAVCEDKAEFKKYVKKSMPQYLPL